LGVWIRSRKSILKYVALKVRPHPFVRVDVKAAVQLACTLHGQARILSCSIRTEDTQWEMPFRIEGRDKEFWLVFEIRKRGCADGTAPGAPKTQLVEWRPDHSELGVAACQSRCSARSVRRLTLESSIAAAIVLAKRGTVISANAAFTFRLVSLRAAGLMAVAGETVAKTWLR